MAFYFFFHLHLESAHNHHTQQPNYINMIAGSDFGDNLYNAVNGNPAAESNITILAGSDMPINFTSSALTVVDVLEKTGISWRAYAEGCKSKPIGMFYHISMVNILTIYIHQILSTRDVTLTICLVYLTLCGLKATTVSLLPGSNSYLRSSCLRCHQ